MTCEQFPPKLLILNNRETRAATGMKSINKNRQLSWPTGRYNLAGCGRFANDAYMVCGRWFLAFVADSAGLAIGEQTAADDRRLRDEHQWRVHAGYSEWGTLHPQGRPRHPVQL